jgi:hypothetical protein
MVSVSTGCVGHTSVHSDNGLTNGLRAGDPERDTCARCVEQQQQHKRAWGSGGCARCVEQQQQHKLIRPPSIAIEALVLGDLERVHVVLNSSSRACALCVSQQQQHKLGSFASGLFGYLVGTSRRRGSCALPVCS